MEDMDAAEWSDYCRGLGLSTQAMAAFTDALRNLGSALSTALQTFASDLSPAARERCYRAYAARLNQTRHWRKVSWRRLNRPQRAAAWRLWQAQMTTGCLPAQA